MRRYFAATLGLVALIGAPTVMALGLGDIQVRSSLNQPFVAQVPLLAVPVDEVEAVRVRLADPADFQRMGIEPAEYLSNLDFKVVAGSPPRIEISATRSVREPLLTFLLDVRSATGRVLREYTVFLDPPPPIIVGSPTQAPTRAPPPPPVAAVVSTPQPTVAALAVAVAARPPQPTVAATAPAIAPAAPVESAARLSARSDHYTVSPRETLWGVATAVRPDDTVSMNQVIYALVTANPSAFHRGRFEGLLKDVTLEVPSQAAMLATSSEDAQKQVAAWRRSGSINTTPRAAVPRATAAPVPRRTPRPTATPTPAPTPTPTVAPSATAEPEMAAPMFDDSQPSALDDDVSTTAGPADAAAADSIETADTAAAGDAESDALIDLGDSTGILVESDPEWAVTEAEGQEAAAASDTEPALPEPEVDEEMAVGLVDTSPAPRPSGDERSWWLIALLAAMAALLALLLLRRRQRKADDTSSETSSSYAAAATDADADADATVPGHELPPDSVETAQRQADEAEALFMAAFAEEQAEAERARTQADAGSVDAAPDLDAAVLGVMDETPAEAAPSLQRDEAEAVPPVPIIVPPVVALLPEPEPEASESEPQAFESVPEDADELPLLSFDDETTVPELDVGLDFSLDDPAAPSAQPEASTPKAEVEPAAADNNFIDFDLDFDAPPVSSVASLDPAPEVAAAVDDAALDFELSDFDEPITSPVAAAVPAAAAEQPTEPDEFATLGEFNLDDFDLDDELTPEDDASDSLATGDESATKLDLARAYVDMGDVEMARALLGEVLAEGSETQQDEARALMARMG